MKRQGKPIKTFRETSERSKRRKIEGLRNSTDVGMLIHAVQIIFLVRILHEKF